MNGDWTDPFWFPHTIIARVRRAGGGMGPRPEEPKPVVAEVLDKRELIRDANGTQVVSSTRVTVPIDADVPIGSLVTVWPGQATAREAEVLQVGIDQNGPPLPSHRILWLK